MGISSRRLDTITLSTLMIGLPNANPTNVRRIASRLSKQFRLSARCMNPPANLRRYAESNIHTFDLAIVHCSLPDILKAVARIHQRFRLR
jgi:hypothetical protein